MNRRSFLRAAVGSLSLAVTAGLPGVSRGAPANDLDAASKKVLDRLKGPMASITIPYNKDFSVDHGSLRAWVDFMCENRVPILLLTYGDSELYNLTEAEIEAVTRTVAKQNRGRALFLGGTPHGWTGQLVDFINRVEDCGVDAISVHHYGEKEDEIHRALSQVAEGTRLPLLAYEHNWSQDLGRKVAKIPRMVGMKCHAELFGYYDFLRDTKEDGFAVVSAGQMKHFYFGYPFGSPAYLCALTPFAPQVGVQFYDAMLKGSIEEARPMIFDYEEPLLKVTIPLGYPQCYKSALFLQGLYKTQLVRPPKTSNTPEDLAPLREFLQKRGLLRKTE
jgi:dihydrodipicolinate synthase/N-acetylneuraminate lyase